MAAVGPAFGISRLQSTRAGLLLAAGGEFAFVAFGALSLNLQALEPRCASRSFPEISAGVCPDLCAPAHVLLIATCPKRPWRCRLCLRL